MASQKGKKVPPTIFLSIIGMELAKFIPWWWLLFAMGMSLCSGDQVDAHLKRLNKPPVKSIQSPDGDIIDCVPISQQIAFDHPSLKNHIIQRVPSSFPKGLSKEEELEQLWQVNETCPEETIPVRRTKREDILSAQANNQSFGTMHHRSIGLHDLSEPLYEYAEARDEGGIYYGAEATMNIWEPYVALPKEFSLSHLRLVAGSNSNLNSIHAGWMKFPNFYGNYRTRLFIYWTRDGYGKTGCYNLLCSGFIQTNNNIVIGGAMRVSKYNGEQKLVTILVWKDPGTEHWWLKVGSTVVGYWPSWIFTGLKSYATRVDWGGEIINYEHLGEHTHTDMGSGYFPEEGYRKACFFRNVQYVDASNYYRTPELTGYATPSHQCYSIEIGTQTDSSWGTNFYYGGSGKNSYCY